MIGTCHHVQCPVLLNALRQYELTHPRCCLDCSFLRCVLAISKEFSHAALCTCQVYRCSSALLLAYRVMLAVQCRASSYSSLPVIPHKAHRPASASIVTRVPCKLCDCQADSSMHLTNTVQRLALIACRSCSVSVGVPETP